jgi:hypothetical protein
VVDGTGLENRHTRKGIGGSNPSLSASSSETRQIRAKTQIAVRLCYSASLLSKIQQMRVLAKMNRTVKLYCSVKRPSGDWGTKPVPDKQLMNLKDLPEGQGHYYLAYYEGKHRQMPPVGRFTDAAKQKLVQKRKELDARATGVELPSETKPDPTEESNLAPRVEKYLSQMMAFVGNDGYGRTKKSVNSYRNRLSFYQRFCAQKRITDLRLGDYDHLLEFVGWLRKQTKQNGEEISDRYVFNIFATLGTFALSLDIYGSRQENPA